jgi:hypothetical protein
MIKFDYDKLFIDCFNFQFEKARTFIKPDLRDIWADGF